jgi:hypothetical protein
MTTFHAFPSSEISHFMVWTVGDVSTRVKRELTLFPPLKGRSGTVLARHTFADRRLMHCPQRRRIFITRATAVTVSVRSKPGTGSFANRMVFETRSEKIERMASVSAAT